MVRAFIFDVDGTLVDTVGLHAQAWQDAFRELGHEVPLVELERRIGLGSAQLIQEILGPEEAARIGAQVDAAKRRRFREIYRPRAKAFPKVRELIEALHARGIRAAIASSGKRDDIAYWRKLANIDDLLDAEVTSEDVKLAKPAPDIFLAALKKLAVRPDEARVVGDSPFDLLAARAAAVPAIALRCGGFPEESLRLAGFVAIFDDPSDLCTHLSQVLPRE